MLKFYPSHSHVVNSFRQLCGQHFGIMESQLLSVGQSKVTPRIAIFSSNMPNYHKLVVHDRAEMAYHLAGYGAYREEAMIRLLGEGIERYALVVAAKTLEKRVFLASYNSMKAEPNVMPWELINIYTDADYKKMQGKITVQGITQDDPISWLWCPSIFDPTKEICIPAQLLFTGMKLQADKGEKLFAPGFSKGTAAHTDPKKVLRSAIMEAIEADAFMIRWYAKQKAPRVRLDDPTLNGILHELIGGLEFELLVYDFSVPDVPGYVFGAVLLNKKDERPIGTMGCAAGLKPVQAVYRAILEALAIIYLGSNGPVVAPDFYMPTVEERDYTNLDSNVAYWADTGQANMKRAFLRNLGEGEVLLSSLENRASIDDDDLSYLIGALQDLSSYGVYLDITPPEVIDAGWKVSRVFFPELVQMSLPAFPYHGQPRLEGFGGVQNELPHPSP